MSTAPGASSSSAWRPNPPPSDPTPMEVTAASSDSDMDPDFKTISSCCICYEKYTRIIRQPISMACGHTFCKNCVRQMLFSRVFQCALCRTMSLIVVEKMSKNVELSTILEKFNLFDSDEGLEEAKLQEVPREVVLNDEDIFAMAGSRGPRAPGFPGYYTLGDFSSDESESSDDSHSMTMIGPRNLTAGRRTITAVRGNTRTFTVPLGAFPGPVQTERTQPPLEGFYPYMHGQSSNTMVPQQPIRRTNFATEFGLGRQGSRHQSNFPIRAQSHFQNATVQQERPIWFRSSDTNTGGRSGPFDRAPDFNDNGHNVRMPPRPAPAQLPRIRMPPMPPHQPAPTRAPMPPHQPPATRAPMPRIRMPPMPQTAPTPAPGPRNFVRRFTTINPPRAPQPQ